MTNLYILDLAQVAVDLGVVVLIWLVQLVIYPSFAYYSRVDLLRWHPVYTSAVTVVVMPLMLSQLFLSGLVAYRQYSIYALLHLGLVVLMWGITFLKAVPLHTRLDYAEEPHAVALELVKINWWRSIGWSLVLIVSMFRVLW